MKKTYILSSLLSMIIMLGCGESSNNSNNNIGKAGSMARFSLKGNYLYTLNKSEMNIFDVSEASNPKNISKLHTPFNVETLYSYKDYLYMGASNGVYIYDNSEPTQPNFLTLFTHAQSCDPVILENDIAYVTLNSSNSCWRQNPIEINRLEVLDMHDPKKPKLIKRMEMWEPKGLAINNNKLFICDGTEGLKVFDINETEHNSSLAIKLNPLATNKEIDCYDVITSNNSLIVSNQTNIRQFDHSAFPMELLSEIK